MDERVLVERCRDYSLDSLQEILSKFDSLFSESISPGQTILLKPNWIAAHHKYDPNEWVSVITHPNFITAVIRQVLRHMRGLGKIIVADGPQTDSSFEEIMQRMPCDDWRRLGRAHGVDIVILDLRDHEWIDKAGVTISRRRLSGDPQGSIQYNLKDLSEFKGHEPSVRGYYGADYDIQETNEAHTGGNHLYRISKTVIEADVFINLPKWKTHKKAGITCSLKNLVGVNTYKNFLPHHTEGTPKMGGDQFPGDDLGNRAEVYLLEYFKRTILRFEKYARWFIPVKRIGNLMFGETRNKIRSGNWYGNDTLWRTILDLNKIVLYGNTDGTLRAGGKGSKKRYLSFVDGIISGQGNGPEAPDPINTQIVIGGNNPVSVDCVAAKLMGFNYLKIPALRNAFSIKHLPIVDFPYSDIEVVSETIHEYNRTIKDISEQNCFCFKPHFGWVGHVEL
jgi:uncharacterized protein (DUF362 family)